MTPDSESPPRSQRRGPDSIAKNVASSFAAQLTTGALTAALTVFLVRAIGPKQYGLFALAVGMSLVALALADLGISSSTARFVAEHRGRDTELRMLIADALKLKVIVSGVVCALLAALASVIAHAYGNPELVWPLRAIALALFGQSTFLMVLGVSTALGRAIVNVRLVAAESALEVSASVGLVLAGAGASGAAFGRAIGYVLGSVIAAFVMLRLNGRTSARFWSLPRRETVRQVGGYAGYVFAIDASYILSSQLAVLLVGAYLGPVASGIYSAPSKLITLIQYVGSSFSNGVGPRLSRGVGQEPNVKALNGAVRGLIGFQCVTLAPAVVWARPITHLLLGSGYSKSADVMVALAPYIFFSGFAPLVTTSIDYLGEAGSRLPISVATLALVAGGGVILIPRFGVVGAAVSVDIAFGFYTLAHIWLCRRLLELRIGSLAWSLACGLTAAAAMGIVLESVGTKHLGPLDWLKGGAGGLAAYVAMLIFTREIRGAEIARAAATARGLVSRRRLAPAERPVPASELAVASSEIAVAGPAAQGRPVPPLLTSTGAVAAPDATSDLTAAPTNGAETPVEPSRAGRPSRAAPPPAPLGSDALAMRVAPTDRPSAAKSRSRTAKSAGGAAKSRGRPGGRFPRFAQLFNESGRQRSPAALPPSWLSEGGVDGPASPTEFDDFASLGIEAAAARMRPDVPSRAAPVARGGRSPVGADTEQDEGQNMSRRSSESEYQITWRHDAGVFELRPVDPSVKGEPVAAQQSSVIPWQWRMPPAPMPEARRAHAELVDGLLAGGWRRAGSGDDWFAHRFRSPDPS
jgi:O-antigen/teichoic acid export membrane protein